MIPDVFKAYDIRGIYPSEIDEDFAYRLGKAFVIYTKAKEVAIGRDARLSSPALFKALVKGITEQGADVIDIGLCSTPMFYFAIGNYKFQSGIMISASHNPPQYNGFKLYKKNVEPIGLGFGMEEIKKIFEKDKYSKAKKTGKIRKKEIMQDYIKKIASFAKVKGWKKFKIVADAGNGMAAYSTPKVFDKLRINPKKLCYKIDFTFPNHEPNPMKYQNLKDLQEAIIKEKADLGVAFDGDVDRVGFIDEKGDVVEGDIITGIIAGYLLKKSKGAKIVYEVRTSWAVRDFILNNHGKPILWKAGRTSIMKKMKEEKALFGGEKTGHFFFKDFWCAEDAVIAFTYILNIMSESGKKLSELVEPLMTYYGGEEINFEVGDKQKVIKDVESRYKKDAKRILHIDGITVEFDDWWFNLRASNTEPVIRLNIEAKSKGLVEEKREELSRVIKSRIL